MIKLLYIFIILCVLHVNVSAQIKESIVNRNEKLCLSLATQQEMLVPQEFRGICNYTVDSTGFYYENRTFSQESTAFYDSLRSNSLKYGKFLGQLTEMLTEPVSFQKTVADDHTLQNLQLFDGKIIRNININTQNVFSDPLSNVSEKQTILQSIGNQFHVQTHENIIEQNIFIQKGSSLNPSELADNERYLRQLPFINHAEIQPAMVPGSTDSVDILVTTHDIWSFKAKNQFRATDRGFASFEDKNILGTGLYAGFRLDYQATKKIKQDHAFFLRSENLFGSFISSQLSMLEFDNERYYGIQFDRRFFTRGARTAGGLQLYKSMERHPEYRQKLHTEMNVADIWFGHAFPQLALTNKRQIYPVFSIRYQNQRALQHPQITSERARYWEFRDRQLLLANLALNKRDYLTSYLVSKFGATEDIPLGFNLSTTQGVEMNRYGNRSYSGASVNWASMLSSQRYFYAGCAYGTFYKNSKLHEGTLSFSLNSFSRLYSLKNVKVRHFSGVNYIHGFRQPPGQMINFVYPKAIRGFYDPWIAGTKRLVFNYEAVTFLPFNFYGFRFAGFTFADLGIINSARSAELKNTYAAVGVGFRIRNDHLIIKTMQFAITMLIDPQTRDTRLSFGYNGKEMMNYYDFENAKPDIVQFK